MSALLQGRRVVITRSRSGNMELAGRLRKMGFTPVLLESLEFLPPPEWKAIDERLRNLAAYDWLIFTSSTGVKFFLARMREIGLRVGWTGRPLIAAVGAKTGETLNGAGLKVSFIPSDFLTSRLGEELYAHDGRRVLLLRASQANPELTRILQARGFTVDQLAVYTTSHVEGQFGLRDYMPVDMVIFGSPSAVEGFCARIPREELEQVRGATAVCIGPVTERAARRAGFKNVLVPKEHTYDALLEMIGGSA